MDYHFWISWSHHVSNFPSGQYWLGLPLFAWNRAAKIFLYLGGLVIMLDIIGRKVVNNEFIRLHTGLKHLIERLKIWHEGMRRGIYTWLVLIWGMLRFLFSKETEPQRFTQGKKSLSLGLTIIAIASFSISASALFSVSWLFVPQFSLWQKLVCSIFCFLACFVSLTLMALLMVLTVTVTVWLIVAIILQPLERFLLSITKLLLQRVEDKTAATSWRWMSLVLLTTGFLLDFFTS